VSFFFMLSGFVLAWSHQPGDRPVRFYRRRVARIYPAYLVAVAVGLALAPRILFQVDHTPIGTVLAVIALVQAWSSDPAVYFAVSSPLWSLSCEAFFYLAFPLFIGRLAVLSERVRVALGVAMVATVWAIPLLARPRGEFGFGFWLVYICPLTRLAEFIIGILIALTIRDGRRSPVGLAGAAVLAAAAYVTAGWVPRYLMWAATTVVPFALLIAAAASTDLAGRVPRWLGSRTLLLLGTWSYGFYLLHMYVIGLWWEPVWYFRAPALLVQVGPPLVLSIAAAGILHTLIERPMDTALRGPRR
jgi:peptidoglycan/LPS O-acetylase OafA/YrhL